MPFYPEQTAAVSHLMELDDSCGSFDSTIIKEKMVEVSQAIVVTEPSQGQKSPEVELQPATTNVLMADDPIATEVQGVLTVFDLLAETELTIEQLGEEPTRFEFEQLVVVLFDF